MEKPGKDAGSPLYIKMDVHVDNKKGSAVTLNWKAYVLNIATGKHYPVNLVDKNGNPKWEGTIGDSEIKQAELMTHDGPYLKVGTEVILLLRFKDGDGYKLWLKSKKTRIERTD